MSVASPAAMFISERFISKALTAIMTIALITAVAPWAHALNPPTEDSLWYYEIGGAKVVPNTLNPDRESLTIAGSLELGMGYSCGAFDPVLGVAETLNQVKDGAEDMLKAMTRAATSAIAALPALILQRANPGLYELMQNALVGAKLKVDLATKNCRQMEADIAHGNNPYHELITLSKGNDWKRQMSLGANTAVHAQQAVDAANGASGVPWVLGQSAGGRGQTPLKLTSDIVQAGYNVTLNRPTADALAPPAGITGGLTATWSTPQAASLWVAEVVGEHVVTTCANCPKASTPGQGLVPSVTRESTALAAALANLVASSAPPTRAQLAAVSGPNVALTREVIEALRELSATERAIVQERLVTDIAVSRTLEKSFYARRLLITGGQVPEALASATATRHVNDAIAALDAETARLLFEYRARQQVVSDSLQFLLHRVERMRTTSRGIVEFGPSDDRPLVDGRVTR